MPTSLATAVVLTTLGYLAIGIIVGVLFLASGLSRVDSAARGAPWGFRLLILPGIAALWPVIIVKWLRALRGGAA